MLMKFTGYITVRLNSKRLPQKSIKSISNSPLINTAVKKLNHDITPKEILKQRKAFRGPAIIRNIYSEILNVLQVTVMKKQKQKKLNKRSKKLLDDAMMTSIAGISAAIKNTG